MRIIFEEHQYKAAIVADELRDICALQDVEKKINVGYVGYFYNTTLQDCVFILPKVLLKDSDIKDADGNNLDVVAGVYDADGNETITPEDIITPEGQKKFLSKEYRKFIYEFAVWIYRALDVFRKQNPQSKAVYYHHLSQKGNGKRRKVNTYLDTILLMIRFNRENQNYFMFTVKNQHSGHNKINWTRTISHSQSFVQDNDVIFLNPVNKKRVVNYEEELFVIFFSILNYLNNQYGFRCPINIGYELITGKQFDAYIHGKGKTRLRQIKYKYFSDKALQMWDLCYAFFDSLYKLTIPTARQEYLLAKSFEHVFEAMIDDLIGERDIPNGLKEQLDGKRVDHLYTYNGLTISNDQSEQIYYIGDSKYYKIGHKLGNESIYKQFTYARNVIQWNIDLFVNGKSENWRTKQEFEDDREKYKKIKLRDDEADPLTEGYNVIPNFFISAFVDEERCYDNGKNIKNRTEIVEGEEIHKTYITSQFNDRLFDRDTLLLSHYDVNFLYVVYLYARNKQSEKAVWKQTVRRIFRDEIREVLKEHYDFYALKSKGNPLAGEEFIKEHFKELQGKLYRPYGDKNIFALALERCKGKVTQDTEAYRLLEEYFEIEPIIKLGVNPKDKLEQRVAEYQAEHPYSPTPENWLPEYHVERYLDNHFVVGMYHNQEHWDWITGKNDRGTLIYNVRLDEDRPGSMPRSHIRALKPKFAILYEDGHEAENKYHVFRIHDFAVMNEERMRRALYPGKPKGDYFIFRFDDEVSIGRFDIHAYIKKKRKETGCEKGTPLYPTGRELMEFKM